MGTGVNIIGIGQFLKSSEFTGTIGSSPHLMTDEISNIGKSMDLGETTIGPALSN
jgi:hypothetical protein